MTQLVALSGHTTRVLYLSMSPDGQSVVTGAGDETLRFWTLFPYVLSMNCFRVRSLTLVRPIRRKPVGVQSSITSLPDLR
jgi:WD40 repeat protein